MRSASTPKSKPPIPEATSVSEFSKPAVRVSIANSRIKKSEHERVEHPVHRVEHPAKPASDQRAPLRQSCLSKPIETKQSSRSFLGLPLQVNCGAAMAGRRRVHHAGIVPKKHSAARRELARK